LVQSLISDRNIFLVQKIVEPFSGEETEDLKVLEVEELKALNLERLEQEVNTLREGLAAKKPDLVSSLSSWKSIL
jgi:hypothetical protein